MSQESIIQGSGEQIGCPLCQFERNRYYYGKLLTTRDFKREQKYFIEKNRIINRLIHGIGIVCGLEVNNPVLESGGDMRIDLTPGAALDCCGQEIVVSRNVQVLLDRGSLQEGSNYIYIKYKECDKEPVRTLADPSTCGGTCEYNTTEEQYEVVVSSNPPVITDTDISGTVGYPEGEGVKSIGGAKIEALKNGFVTLSTYTDETGNYSLPIASGTDNIRASASGFQSVTKTYSNQNTLDFILSKETEKPDAGEHCTNVKKQYYSEHLRTCPECSDPKVFLAVLSLSEGETSVIIEEETAKYRSIVSNNPMLQSLLCDHLSDFNNPHRVPAIFSVDGVENPGGNIDLISQNSITIVPDDDANSITIGENHSARTDNPHNTTAQQVGALVSVDGVSNPGGNVELTPQNSITIVPNDNANSITIGENHSVQTNNPHKTTAEHVKALQTINKIGNVNGAAQHVSNIDLISTDKSISIEPVQNSNNQIDVKLAQALQEQLNILFMYIRERALKCTWVNFTEFIKTARQEEISQVFQAVADMALELVNKDAYREEETFNDGIRAIFERLKEIDLAKFFEEGSFEKFEENLELLSTELDRENSLAIARIMDELCFYVLHLRLIGEQTPTPTPTLRPTPTPTLRPTPTLGPTPPVILTPGEDVSDTVQPTGRSIREIGILSDRNVKRLEKEGITDSGQIASMDPSKLADILNTTPIKAKGIIDEAKRLEEE